ncbi:DNA gyrase subunit A [Candidatus Methylacidithermus pantelleriae]|uniref:DNA gyrase subunit A n=1 Tax=Candidatus Methylacidithermus pantelleriae TaxID=2744239 RepID=A0A8J2BKC3_9BACT|nr:DNA gyrase subunit A [Candidatus Methylacidithermus pantelleriae]CAF0695915.1 DNA gyrase subunit A [Candidatus Methylacidithermus pantelleriae]
MPESSPSSPDAPLQGGRIERVNVAEEMKNCFLDYSMSVIISRALPDVRDGLKPSQRRILYSMHELGLAPNRKHLKCAKIVGETMGNYHPHGDQAIYPTLVHMAQAWAMREPLVDGQGNFGSIEGDPPAAMRYTEARLSPLGALLMQDMEKDTVDFVPNYDETRKEPVVFPAAFPNLLVNGSTGIAVGMATNIPPHNLKEAIDAVCALIERPDLSIEELLSYIPGPDFPTGGVIVGTSGIREYFATGKGSIRIRGRLHIEESKTGRPLVIVDDIPFNVNRAMLVSRIGELITNKVLTDVTDVRDESDENTRIVLELKKEADPRVVVNNLYRLSALESVFAVNMLAIDGGRPRTLNLKELIECYLRHRREVVVRRTRFDLKKAEERAEILEAYLIALANLDDFLEVIRNSENRAEAKIRLRGYEFTKEQVEHFGIVIRNPARLHNGRYRLSDAQVDAILDLRLYQLTGLERRSIGEEYNQWREKIRELSELLGSEQKIMQVVKEELQAIREKHGDARRSEIMEEEEEVSLEDYITNECVIITMSHEGLIKRTSLTNYRSQRRGGRGVTGMVPQGMEGTDSRDFVEHLFTAATHDYLVFFTTEGRAHAVRVYEVPDMGRATRGRSIANLLELQPQEKVAAMVRIPFRRDDGGEDASWRSGGYLFFSTASGLVKKTALEEFRNIRRGGIMALGIEPGDRLIDVKLTQGSDEVVLVTRQGMSIRFSEKEVRPMGRQARGVRGIELEEGDEVVSVVVASSGATLLVAGENGLGKRTRFDEYRCQARGGKGIITMRRTENTGEVVGALSVCEEDEIMLITQNGLLVRIRVQEIPVVGRNTQGVRLIRLAEGDRLVALARVYPEDDREPELPA